MSNGSAAHTWPPGRSSHRQTFAFPWSSVRWVIQKFGKPGSVPTASSVANSTTSTYKRQDALPTSGTAPTTYKKHTIVPSTFLIRLAKVADHGIIRTKPNSGFRPRTRPDHPIRDNSPLIVVLVSVPEQETDRLVPVNPANRLTQHWSDRNLLQIGRQRIEPER